MTDDPNMYSHNSLYWFNSNGEREACPLVPVRRHEYTGACRYTGYQNKTIKLFLECGHMQFRKLSQGVPARARCSKCREVATNTEGEG